MNTYKYRITGNRMVLVKGTIEAPNMRQAFHTACKEADTFGPKAVSVYVEKKS